MGVVDKPEDGWVVGIRRYLFSPYFLITMAAHVVAMAVMIGTRVDLQWFWLLLYSWCTVPFSPWVSDAVRFLRGGLNDDQGNTFSFGYLTCSVFVIWVFAKSIYNSSTLGASFGITGGLAYAAYYTSFPAVGICIYFLRTRFGYQSLPEAISQRYGPTATVAFGCAVLYRLYQEVWSNSLVIGGFFGEEHSGTWWAAVIVSTAIPAFYSITGGMRSSLLTDVYQAAWKIVLLIIILSIIGARKTSLPGNPEFGTFNPKGTCSLSGGPDTFTGCAQVVGNPLAVGSTSAVADPVKQTFKFSSASCAAPFKMLNQTLCSVVNGTWVPASCTPTTEPACDTAGGGWSPRRMGSLEGGVDLLVVALLQGILSYPFFDPVLTDRAFLATPKTMLAAFLTGGAMAATFILLFSFIGIFGAMQTILAPQDVDSSIFANMSAGIPAAVAKFFGTATYSLLNIVFIISSCAVLDSTFASTAKLFGPEFIGLITTGRPLPPSAAKPVHAWVGRFMIVIIAVAGTLSLIQSEKALNATTVSGTMIMGLGPPVWALTFIKGYRPLTFHLPFWAGVAFGVVMQLSTDAHTKSYLDVSSWNIGTGSYAQLLGFNVVGAVVCWSLMLLTLVENWQCYDLSSFEPFSLLGASWKGLQNLAGHVLPTHYVKKMHQIGKGLESGGSTTSSHSADEGVMQDGTTADKGVLATVQMAVAPEPHGSGDPGDQEAAGVSKMGGSP